MRDVQFQVFQYDELPEKAQERARDWYTSQEEVWAWDGEWWQSAQEFSAIAPIDIHSADYARAHVNIVWTGSDAVEDLEGLRAWKWLLNNGWFELARRNVRGDCTLTGFCGDCELFDPLPQYERNPSRVPTLRQVFYECAQSWVYGARNDWEASYETENVAEAIRANEYEFTEEGEFWA